MNGILKDDRLSGGLLESGAGVNVNLRERKVLTYRDVLAAKAGDSAEMLVDVREYDPTIFAKHENAEMEKYTGDHILVRREVARRLAKINQGFQGEYRIKVVFGYRHPDVQQKYFDIERAKFRVTHREVSEEELDELTHSLIAVPEVAGHPTGGAVDIALVDSEGVRLDMGSPISDFSRPEVLPTFSPVVSITQLKNRLILHDVMIAGGFAPFYGEWWHFSYGDREWAAFYGEERALYGRIHVKET